MLTSATSICECEAFSSVCNTYQRTALLPCYTFQREKVLLWRKKKGKARKKPSVSRFGYHELLKKHIPFLFDKWQGE